MDDEKYGKKIAKLAAKQGWSYEDLGEKALDFIEMDTDPETRAKFFRTLKTIARYERQSSTVRIIR